MNNAFKLTLTITKDYCHKEVIDLFKKISTNDSHFFAITSDIDNLGEYIAYNGRARGQNLVDYYTNLIAEFIIQWSSIKGYFNLVLIPAGEEVSIFGLCSQEYEFKMLIDGLRIFVRDRIINSTLGSGQTGIKFGGKIIDEEFIHIKIKDFLFNIQHHEDFNPFDDYYDILYEIRTVVTPFVDLEKFRTLGVQEKQDIIFLRNVIYNELLEYKKNTRELLVDMAQCLNSSNVSEDLMESYGLNETKINKIAEIKEKQLTRELS